MRSMQDDVAKAVKEHGFSICAISASSDSPSFTYTVGLTETYGHPELIVFGIGGRNAAYFLTMLAAEIANGSTIQVESIRDDLANLPFTFKLVSSAAVENYAAQAFFYYENTSIVPTFMQMVITDKVGLFPWDAKYDPSMRTRQPELWVEARRNSRAKRVVLCAVVAIAAVAVTYALIAARG